MLRAKLCILDGVDNFEIYERHREVSRPSNRILRTFVNEHFANGERNIENNGCVDSISFIDEFIPFECHKNQIY